MAQSITTPETTVEMYQGGMHETELTVNANGCRVVDRWYISSDPSVVNVIEINFYSLTNNIFGWILRFMGAKPMNVGIAVVTAYIVLEDENGNEIVVSSNIFVRIIESPIGWRQVLSTLKNIMIGDAIKEDN